MNMEQTKSYNGKFKQFLHRVKVAWGIVTYKKRHCAVIHTNTKDLHNLFQHGGLEELEIDTLSMRKYILLEYIRTLSDYYDENDLILEKAKFTAEADLLKSK